MYSETQGPNPKTVLASQLATLLADLTILRSLAQGYHWNIKGPNFPQYHDFFAAIYDDVSGSIDPMAENIRKLGHDSPYLLQDFLGLSNIADQQRQVGWERPMLGSLLEANAVVADELKIALKAAEQCNEQGIVDFLGGRIDMHMKWDWQLKATLVDSEELEG